MIPVNTTKKIMKKVTIRSISESAITYLNLQIEEWIINITKKADELLTETNTIRKSKGVREKKRLSIIEVKEVIE
jgi:histone H3/H4